MSTVAHPVDFFLVNDWEPEPLPVAELKNAVAKNRGEHFAKATIAHNLKKKADAFVADGTVLMVVGNDLPNVTADDYPWTSTCLPEWLNRGATVRYFAIDPSERALKKLGEIAAESKGHLEVRRLRHDKKLDQPAEKLARMWKTFHFAVFENQPQLWVELFHPAGKREALDCYYFPPGKAEEMPLYETCRSRFNYMFENFGERVVSSH